jgi:hypothetical protein
MRLLREPEFETYRKRNNQGTADNGVHSLLLPQILLRQEWSPLLLEQFVRDCVLCDYIDGKMEPDNNRTEEMRDALYHHSPKILIMGQIFVKNGNNEGSLYRTLQKGEVVPADSPLDYIMSRKALDAYCARAEIASDAQVKKALREGSLHYYEIVPKEKPAKKAAKKTGKRGRPKKEESAKPGVDFDPLQPKKKGIPQLFLLEEVNALRG